MGREKRGARLIDRETERQSATLSMSVSLIVR